jgi:hypothetical protein
MKEIDEPLSRQDSLASFFTGISIAPMVPKAKILFAFLDTGSENERLAFWWLPYYDLMAARAFRAPSTCLTAPIWEENTCLTTPASSMT